MTLLSVLEKPMENEALKLSPQEMAEFMEGIKQGSIARSEGKVQPLDEVVTELGIP
jgi:hypothetical protein